MAIEINNEVMETIITEQIAQNTRNFFRGTGGAITPMTKYHKGDFEEELSFASLGGLKRRDPNANNSAVADTLNTANQTGVKLYFYKDVEYKLTDIKRYGKNPDALAVRIGEDLGRAVTVEMLNKALIAGVAAIGAGTGTTYTAAGGTIDLKTLNSTLALMGDAFGDVNAFVMDSVAYFALNEAGIAGNFDTVASGVLYQATPATMGRKAYVTDSPALNDGTNKKILALTKGAIVVEESEERLITSEIVTGGENAIYRIHIEGALTVKVKGYSYAQSAGANPNDATLGASANWAMIVGDKKHGAGVMAIA